jgi:hypothetical protein
MDFVKKAKEELEKLEQILTEIEENKKKKEKIEEEIFSKKGDLNELNQKFKELEEKMKKIDKIIEEREREVSKRELEMKSMEDKMEEALGKKPEIIKLNVGGKLFMSTKTTLSKSLLLKNMLSKTKPQLENDCYFLDRPSEYFEEILHFLLTGIWKNEKVEKSSAFRKELEYYEIGKPVESKKTQTGNKLTSGTPGKEKKKNTLAKIDKNLNLFKFKTNDDKTFEISKELLDKFPDSLFYKMLTTNNLIEMDGEFIFFDRTLLQVSVVLDYMNEEPLKYDQYKSIEEMVDCFQFCCIHVEVKEEEFLFDENIQNQYNQPLISFPKIPQLYSKKINDFVGILRIFGFVEMDPRKSSFTRIYFTKIVYNPKYEVMYMYELSNGIGCKSPSEFGFGLLDYFNLKYYKSFQLLIEQSPSNCFVMVPEKYKLDFDFFYSDGYNYCSDNFNPLKECFPELQKYKLENSWWKNIETPFKVLNGVHVFKSKLETPFDVDSLICSLFPDKKGMARFLDANFRSSIRNGKVLYSLNYAEIPIQILKRAHTLNKDWKFQILQCSGYYDYLPLNKIESSVQFIELCIEEVKDKKIATNGRIIYNSNDSLLKRIETQISQLGKHVKVLEYSESNKCFIP